MSLSLSALHIRAVVLDIEGTTTPVDFVYQVLFPYAREHAEAYLTRESWTASCQQAVELLRREGGLENRDPLSVVAYVYVLMDEDRKSPGLKMLQGLIWRDGYERGELKGSVYADVPRALERWRAGGIDVYIYSSGSVLAQQLLFGSTEAGDLTRLLNGYFDTAVGPKQSPESYRAILERIQVEPAAVLFVSDAVGELDAARSAGIKTALAVRGAAAASTGTHPVIRTFDELTD